MKANGKSMNAGILPCATFMAGLLFTIMFAASAEAIIPISDEDVIAARGWDMGACRIPTGTNSTTQVCFADGEIVGMPIHINNRQDNPDLIDMCIVGSPIFLERVEMGESRYTAEGVDKYAEVMSCFQNGIYFDVPDSAISDEAAVEETIDRFRDSTDAFYSFAPVGTASFPMKYDAVQFEFFVEGEVGKVRITNNCSVRGHTAGTFDYEVVPASNGNTFQKYYIYDYHCKPVSEESITVPIEDTYVTQEFDGYEGDPAGQIFVDGSVVIGGDSDIYPDQVVKGNITIIATGNIWVADSIFVDGPHDSNGMPTADNPNVLGLVARRLIKVVNPTSNGSPYVPAGQTYQPIGIIKPGYSGRYLPDPTVVEAAITVGGGGWGAEGVHIPGRREYSGPVDDLIVNGAIAEVVRGPVGLVGADGYVKHYDYDRRLLKTSLFVLTPDGGENLVSGKIHIIRWSSHSCISDVLIEYSADEGESWTAVCPPNAGNSGSYNWLVPELDSDSCLVRVSEASDPNISDTSDDVFTIFHCIENSKADLNNDCKVDLEDFSLFAEEWLFNGEPF